ncbi:hypothetical protein JCM21900_006118 [Sporobolomyces salmonicolor]
MAFLSSTFQTHRLPSIRSLPELAKHLPPSPPPLNNSSADEDTERSWTAAVKESTTEEADVDEDKILIKPKVSSRVGLRPRHYDKLFLEAFLAPFFRIVLRLALPDAASQRRLLVRLAARFLRVLPTASLIRLKLDVGFKLESTTACSDYVTRAGIVPSFGIEDYPLLLPTDLDEPLLCVPSVIACLSSRRNIRTFRLYYHLLLPSPFCAILVDG